MSAHPHNTAYRGDRLWLAAMVHRVSGVLLAAFLPLHFLVLGLAIESEGQLDGFLQWTKSPLVRLHQSNAIRNTPAIPTAAAAASVAMRF